MLDSKNNKKFFWMIVFIISLVFGFSVRLYYGLSTDLWGDEAITYFIAKNSSWFDLIFSTGKYWDFVHPPMYYIYSKLGLLFGNQDWLFRLLALIWFVPSLFLVNEIGKKLGNKNTGLIAMSLFALHPLLNGLAFQVRPYPLVIFFMLLFLNLFLGKLNNKSKYSDWFLGFILAVSFYADYATVWLVFSLIFFAVWLWMSNKNEVFKFVLKVLMFFTIFAAYQIFILIRLLFAFKGDVIAGSVRFFTFQGFSQEFALLFGFGMFSLSLVIAIAFCFAILRKRNTRINQFLVVVVLSSLILSVIYSLWRQPIFLAKNLVVVSISLIFILAQFHKNIRNYIMIVLILLLYGYRSFNAYGFLYSVDLGKNIKESQVSNDDIVVSFVDSFDSFSYYLETNHKSSQILISNKLTLHDRDKLRNQNKIILLTDYCENAPDLLYNCTNLLKTFEQEFCTNKICQKINF